jgi:hypothetical protein
MSQFKFRTPAGIQDFASSPAQQAAMNDLWSNNLDGFTRQAMLGNPWNATNVPPATNYYNPIVDGTKSSTVAIPWGAFPGRLAFNYPNATQAQLNQMADTGNMASFGNINNNPCGSGSPVPFYPYGPRGWQDEYCEWAVTRNSAGKITRIDFTCENPEYWNSLWLIDPRKVLSLYQSILNKPQITLADLSLPGVTNPVTGQAVYNPLNKWNSGTVSDSTKGGAIHLTSTPNTLQTEIGLASQASVQRNNPPGTTGNTFWPSSQYNDLLCNAQYGQKNRNSDPNIGGGVNNRVLNAQRNTVLNVTLADPPGLYIQMPDFSNYKTPDGTPAATFWTIARGSRTLNDQFGKPMPGNFILHAVFEVPAGKNYTVGDITIGNQPIDWGSQVAATFKMQIVASAYKVAPVPRGYDAVGSPATSYAQPLQLFYADLFKVMYGQKVPNPVNNPIPLLSNSTYVPLTIKAGTRAAQMVVVADTCTAQTGQPATYPAISFNNAGITATVTAVMEKIYYAVPGNSQPGYYTALFIAVNVATTVAPGAYSLFVTNKSQPPSKAMPALLRVV